MARGAGRHHHRLAVWGDREDRLTTEGEDTWPTGQDVTITAWPSGGGGGDREDTDHRGGGHVAHMSPSPPGRLGRGQGDRPAV